MRLERKSCDVTCQPLMNAFSDLANTCCCGWPNWNTLSAAFANILRLMCSDPSNTFVGGDNKFSTETFLLRSSELSRGDPVYHLQ